MILIKLIAIASPATDAGKTFLAAGIAQAAAYSGLKTAFLDYDISVGDALRVFGLMDKARTPHPTVASWKDYQDIFDTALKTDSGIYVYPKPENPLESITKENIVSFYQQLSNFFDVVVADLGTDHRLSHWDQLINAAHVTLLVVDCDEKGLVRVENFIRSALTVPPGGWLVAINAREKTTTYSLKEIARIIRDQNHVTEVIQIPYFPGIEKRIPKTFHPDSRFAKLLMNGLLDDEPSFSQLGINDITEKEMLGGERLTQSLGQNLEKDSPVPKTSIYRPSGKKIGEKFRNKISLPICSINNRIRDLSDSAIDTMRNLIDNREPVSDAQPYKNIITVWSPFGYFKSITALNLAIASKAALINFDLVCPELDIWFGIRQTGIQEATEKDAGILTMGESMSPELVPKILREIKWGIRYLPAGNKLGNIGTPDFSDVSVGLFKEIIKKASHEARTLIVDAGRDFEYPSTFAALSEADIILIPMLGLPQEADIISQQLTELKRVKVEKPTIELLYVTEDGYEKAPQICDRRIEININFPQIIKASMQKLPHCLNEGRDVWNYISAQINL